MEGLGGFIIVLAVIYMVPWVIAAARSHKKAIGIFWLNLLLGWTAIGWIGLFIYAVLGESATKGEDDPSGFQ